MGICNYASGTSVDRRALSILVSASDTVACQGYLPWPAHFIPYASFTLDVFVMQDEAATATR